MILTRREIKSEFLNDIPVFTDIEPELLNFTKGCRVLPAPFYEEPQLVFELIQRYEPGENKYFPNGGFEIYGPGHERRSFDLDQVVVHPFALNKMGYFKNTDNLVVKNKITDPNKSKGKRGRPRKLDENGNPIVKENKEYVPTGGKRGRPRKLDENGNPNIKEKKEYIPNGGKRGRKPLSEEEKAKRELEKQNKIKTTGGKRGRPSTLTAEQKEEKLLIEEEKNRLRALGLLRRGRPSFK